MPLRRLISAVAPSYVVDAVRARRLRSQQEEEARLAALQQAREAEMRAAQERAARVASWDEACARAHAGGYHTKGLTRFRVARARLHAPDGSLLLANILGMALRLAGRKDVAVTDFGGSTGELGADVLMAWPGARYTVVEHPRLVGLMQADGVRPGVRYAAEIPAQCDIFYCSGALQYLAEPLEIWAQGLQSATRAAILRRNYFAPEECFDVQTSRLFENGFGPLPAGFADCSLAYPRRTLVERHIHDLARHYGFRCIANLDDPEDPGAGRYSRQLVFWRDLAPMPEKVSLAQRLTRAIRAPAGVDRFKCPPILEG